MVELRRLVISGCLQLLALSSHILKSPPTRWFPRTLHRQPNSMALGESPSNQRGGSRKLWGFLSSCQSESISGPCTHKPWPFFKFSWWSPLCCSLPLNILSFQEVSSSHPGPVNFLLITEPPTSPLPPSSLESISVQSLGTKYISRQHWASFWLFFGRLKTGAIFFCSVYRIREETVLGYYAEVKMITLSHDRIYIYST